MDDFPNFPNRKPISLADFVADLRSLVFKRKTEAADHFHLNNGTIGRYEMVDGLRAPLGYLASLAVMFVDLQKDDFADTLGNPEYLLKEINRLIRAEYEEQAPFKNWEGLVGVANAYIQQRNGIHTSKADIPKYVKEHVNLFLEVALLPEIKNNYQKSTEYAIRGFYLASETGYEIGAIDALSAKASICLFRNRYIEARSAYREALDLAVSVNDIHRVNEIKKQQELLNEFMDKKVFISYNNADRNFVRGLANNLQAVGLSIWWDEWEIKVGDSIVQKVGSGITTAANLVVVLSPSSVNSPWVQREVGSALMKQLSSEKGIKILPVLLEDCDIPVLLRDIRWADFRKSYEAGLAEVLTALR
jgi:hypothetical protein